MNPLAEAVLGPLLAQARADPAFALRQAHYFAAMLEPGRCIRCRDGTCPGCMTVLEVGRELERLGSAYEPPMDVKQRAAGDET